MINDKLQIMGRLMNDLEASGFQYLSTCKCGDWIVECRARRFRVSDSDFSEISFI